MGTVHVLLKQIKTNSDDIFNADLSRMIVRDDFTSYESNLIKASVLAQGALSFFNESAESHIFFYPDQLPHLRELLEIAEKQVLVFPAPSGAQESGE